MSALFEVLTVLVLHRRSILDASGRSRPHSALCSLPGCSWLHRLHLHRQLPTRTPSAPPPTPPPPPSPPPCQPPPPPLRAGARAHQRRRQQGPPAQAQAARHGAAAAHGVSAVAFVRASKCVRTSLSSSFFFLSGNFLSPGAPCWRAPRPFLRQLSAESSLCRNARGPSFGAWREVCSCQASRSHSPSHATPAAVS